MKTIVVIITIVLCAATTHAQRNTFPFPATGNVGIGTDSPKVTLDVKGDFKLGVDAGKGGLAYSIGFTRSNAQLYGYTTAGLSLGGDADGVDMNIAPNGNVGIGVVNAAARLHIVNGQQQIQFGTGLCTSGYTLSIGVNDDGANFYHNSSTRGFNFGNLNGRLLSISPGGNLGVGTPAGSMRMEVNGILRSSAPVVFFGPGTATENSNTVKRGLYVDNGLSSGWDLLTLQNTIGLQLKVAGNGNVGIGTLNPKGYKLAVEGTIGGRRVKVTQESWADFVFQPGYVLPALDDVAGYIQLNKHLPGIPTEIEVKEEGIDLGEMNKLLLQKVEEQMLYIIQLNKQLQELTRLVKIQGK